MSKNMKIKLSDCINLYTKKTQKLIYLIDASGKPFRQEYKNYSTCTPTAFYPSIEDTLLSNKIASFSIVKLLRYAAVTKWRQQLPTLSN